MEPSIRPSERVRLAGLDAARLLATFGIVWVHVAEGHDQSHTWTSLGRFGTSFYVIVAALFVVQGTFRDTPRTLFEEFVRRTQRLLKPYLIWCLIYGGYYAMRAQLNSGSVSWKGLSTWWGPVAGTAVHLWFLPFVFVWGLVAVVLTPRLAKLPRKIAIYGGLLSCLALYWVCYRKLHIHLSRPWLWRYHLHRLDRWIVEVPLFLSAVWGATMVRKWGAPLKQFVARKSASVAIAGIVGFAGAEFLYSYNVMALKRATLSDGRFMANIAALFFFIFVLAQQERRWVQRLAPWGRYTYLAFLVHMLLIELLRHPVKSMPGYETLWFSLVESLVIFAGSLLVSRTIARTPWLKFLKA